MLLIYAIPPIIIGFAHYINDFMFYLILYPTGYAVLFLIMYINLWQLHGEERLSWAEFELKVEKVRVQAPKIKNYQEYLYSEYLDCSQPKSVARLPYPLVAPKWIRVTLQLGDNANSTLQDGKVNVKFCKSFFRRKSPQGIKDASGGWSENYVLSGFPNKEVCIVSTDPSQSTHSWYLNLYLHIVLCIIGLGALSGVILIFGFPCFLRNEEGSNHRTLKFSKVILQ